MFLQMSFCPERWNCYFQTVQESNEKCKTVKRSRIYFKIKKKKTTLSYLLDHPKTDKQGGEKDRTATKISKYNSYSSDENAIKL